MRRLTLVAALTWGCSSPGGHPVSGDDAGAADAGNACGSFGCLGAETAEASLPLQARKTLQGCGGIEYCHANNAGGMTLLGGGVFDATIGVQSNERPEMLRVTPGEPLQSYLYLKVLCDGGIEGGCMTGGPNVARMFHDWIEAGAPTN